MSGLEVQSDVGGSVEEATRPAEQLAVAALAVNGEPREVQRQLEELRHDERRSADKFPKSGLDLRWFIWLVQKSSARR